MFELTQGQLAELTGKTTRQLRNWEQDGLPVRAEGNRKFYPARAAVAFWHERELAQELEKVEASESQELRQRKLAAQTQLLELQADEREGEVIQVEHHRKVVGLIATRVRDAILALPNRASDVLGLTGMAEAQEALRRISEEQLGDLVATLPDKLEAEGQQPPAIPR